MTTNEATVSFIRHVMADGVVTEDEVVALGTYLNENRDARKSWPGTAIFEVLKDVFADGRIDSHEVLGLTKILHGIEIICAGNVTGDTNLTVVPVAEDSDTKEFKLPVLDQTVTISATSQFDSTHKVNLKRHECDCKDWKQIRSRLPEFCPGRLCKHLVKGFELSAAAQPDFKAACDKLFLGLIKVSADTDRGFESVDHWKLLKKEGAQFLVAWGLKSDWCNVYAQSESGRLERFGYHVANKRWSFGSRPPKAGMLKKFFESNF